MAPAPDRRSKGLLSTLRAFMSPAMFTAESGFAAAARLRARVLTELAAAPVARPDAAAPARATGGDGGSGTERRGRRRRRTAQPAAPAMPTGRPWGRPAAREEG